MNIAPIVVMMMTAALVTLAIAAPTGVIIAASLWGVRLLSGGDSRGGSRIPTHSVLNNFFIPFNLINLIF